MNTDNIKKQTGGIQLQEKLTLSVVGIFRDN